MPQPSPIARNIDSKGRLTLGERFANRTVIIEERSDDEVVVRLARVIPERESWLYQNADALKMVRKGLQQARAGQVSKNPPDLKSAQQLADQIEDN